MGANNYHLVLWTSVEPHTTSVLAENKIRIGKKKVTAKWDGEWFEAKILKTSCKYTNKCLIICCKKPVRLKNNHKSISLKAHTRIRENLRYIRDNVRDIREKLREIRDMYIKYNPTTLTVSLSNRKLEHFAYVSRISRMFANTGL